jgi:hypothetical protein
MALQLALQAAKLRYRLQNEGIARRLSGRRRLGGRRYERIGCEGEDACELYLLYIGRISPTEGLRMFSL